LGFLRIIIDSNTYIKKPKITSLNDKNPKIQNEKTAAFKKKGNDRKIIELVIFV
jgi:hypothetical protein